MPEARAAKQPETDLQEKLREAERRLQEAEARHELVMDAVREGVWDWNIAEGTMHYSDRVRTYVGLPRDMLMTPDDWIKRIHPDDVPHFRSTLVAHMKGETPRLEMDYRFKDMEGRWRWARSHGLCIRDKDGRAIRMVGSTGDVTEERRAVQELHNARDRAEEALAEQTALRGVLEALSRTAFDLDAVLATLIESATRLSRAEKGFIFRLEKGAYRLLVDYGASAEFREFHLRRPIPPGRGSLVGRTALTASTVHIEDVLVDPEYTWAESQRIGGYRTMLGVPIVRDGAVIGVIALWKDRVEPFSAAQIALVSDFSSEASIAMENARLFRETKEALEQQTAIADVLRAMSGSPGDTQPVFEAIVQAGLRLFPGAVVIVRLPEGDRIRIAAIAAGDPAQVTLWRNRAPIPLTREYVNGLAVLERRMVDVPDGETHADPQIAPGIRNFLESGYRAVTIMPMIRGESAIGTVGIVRREPGPLTERQIALLRTFADQAVIALEIVRLFQELAAANRHKSEFLQNMSHELRTPLNSIIGFARIVARHAQDRLEPKQIENLERILTSGQHLLVLINAILDLSKVEAGKLEVRAVEVALAPVLEQCLKTIEPLARVALVREFGGALPLMLVDEEKLRQIVLNLLSNAAKFTERGAIRLSARASGGAVAIAVADTGIGIPADKLGVIFEEFEQVDSSRTRMHGGTGLGLAIARRLARLMGGDIAVESAKGQGSTFTLTLPVRYQ